jgi:hypothetical protein
MPDTDSNFFTQRPAARFTVPHAPLGERWMLVAHAAVTAAFVIIRKRGFGLRDAAENSITNKLEGILVNDILNRGSVDGFDKNFFCRVNRGSEVENFSGEKIGKKPDLVFHLQRENSLWDIRQDALFAECKPVDRDHSLSANYCGVGTNRVGVERFVIGDYAWAMHEALMIGYVRDGFHIHPHLAECLADPTRHKSLGEPSPPEPVHSGCDGTEPLHQTRHLRRFVWKENGQPATPIALYHSWHDCG